MRWSMLCCLLSFDLLSQNCASGAGVCAGCGLNCTVSVVSCCSKYVWSKLETATDEDIIDAMNDLENILEETKVVGTLMIHSSSLVILLFKPNDTAESLEIFASDSEAALTDVPEARVHVRLPREVIAGGRNAILFSLLQVPETVKNILGSSYEVYDRRLVGLSVQGRNISGLQQHVNITMNLTKEINETQKPSCHFFNVSTKSFSQDGCITQWTCGQKSVTCSCDHLTYFAVLMLPDSPDCFSSTDEKILTYISLIGCSLSLFALVITVLIFITNRKLREDASMKIHISLVFALILLNLHFLLSETVSEPSTGFCLYMALVLHYSLLASFCWMALEGFNLYLLFVKVFDIYVSRYLLKLSVVGWGVPAAIVSVVVLIDPKFYGRVNSAAVCYITNETVKLVTTAGLFSIVFLYNMIMFAVTVGRVFTVGNHKKADFARIGRHICPLLGVGALLGISWVLVVFSFGSLTTPGLYLFCILNSLQGFFIFLWFVMSLRKAQNSAPQKSSEARSTNNQLSSS